MRLLLLTPVVLSLAACHLTVFRKADDAAVTMKTAASTVDTLQSTAGRARDELGQLLSTDAKLAEEYARFVKSATDFDADIERVTKAVNEVEVATGNFLTGYAATREEIKNPDLRAAMLLRKEQIERQLADLKVKASALVAAAGGLAQEFGDLRKFLAANLNAQAVTAASVVVAGLEKRAAEIDEAARGMKIELTDLAASLESESGR